MYLLCIRDSNCENEICIDFELDDIDSMLKFIKEINSRANEYLCFEIMVAK